MASPIAAANNNPPMQQPSGLSRLVLDFVSRIPSSTELQADTPRTKAESLSKRAASQAGLVAGTLALPPGPLGWLTIVPELMAIWRIQAQMVADIAAAYGKTQAITRERMIYCLFRHAAAQAVRDIGIRVGERILASQFMRNMGEKVGVRVAERAAGKAFSRFIPIIGAIGVGAYAYYDTRQVAKLTIAFLEASGTADSPSITVDAKNIEAVTIESQPALK